MRDRSIHLRLVALLGVSVSLVSCDTSIEDLCKNTLGKFDQQTHDAILALGPWLETPDSPKTRQLAEESRSRATPKKYVALAARDRDAWKKWAEERLKATQSYVDLTEGDPSKVALRKALSDIAVQLVVFHGYTQRGEVNRMVTTLERISLQSKHAEDSACKF